MKQSGQITWQNGRNEHFIFMLTAAHSSEGHQKAGSSPNSHRLRAINHLQSNPHNKLWGVSTGETLKRPKHFAELPQTHHNGHAEHLCPCCLGGRQRMSHSLNQPERQENQNLQLVKEPHLFQKSWRKATPEDSREDQGSWRCSQHKWLPPSWQIITSTPLARWWASQGFPAAWNSVPWCGSKSKPDLIWFGWILQMPIVQELLPRLPSHSSIHPEPQNKGPWQLLRLYQERNRINTTTRSSWKENSSITCDAVSNRSHQQRPMSITPLIQSAQAEHESLPVFTSLFGRKRLFFLD